MKFIVFVEGHSEKMAIASLLKRWLDPKLPEPVGIQPVRFSGWKQLVEDAPKKAEMYLGKSEVLAIISLLDLYGPTFYPADKISAVDRYNWAKVHIEKKVGQAKFKQHFAVHEFEAWLLSDLSLFPFSFPKEFENKARNPESVNFNNPPKKVLNEYYQQQTRKKYKQTTYGKNLFDRLNPSIAYSKCPQLKVLLDDMLSIAKKHYNAE